MSGCGVLRHRDKKGERAKAAVADVTAFAEREALSQRWEYRLALENRGPSVAHDVRVSVEAGEENAGLRMLYDTSKPIPVLDVGAPFRMGFIPLGGLETLRIELSWKDGRKGRQQKSLTRPMH